MDFLDGSRGTLVSQVMLSKVEIQSKRKAGEKYTLVKQKNTFADSSLLCKKLGASLSIGNGSIDDMNDGLKGEHYE